MSNAPDDLSEFVKAALGRRVPRADIEGALRQAGWTTEQVREALAGFADTEFLVPVPRPRPYLDARDAFMYLVLFSTLYVSAYHLGSLLFDIINAAFPDPADPGPPAYARQSIRWSISSLVVAFPVFVYMSWRLSREVGADPNKRRSKVRRWLTYVTLFVAAAILVGDVITLVYSVLGGELTTRFVLKILVVGGVAGSTFWSYLSDIGRGE